MLGAALYVLASFAADWKILALFVACFCVIASMYGGGFATIPAYLADMFGTQFVGAIHGRLLTAWSTAGILGPVIVNYLHDTAPRRGHRARSDLRADLLYSCRHAGRRLHRQPAGAPGQPKMAHERGRRRGRAGQAQAGTGDGCDRLGVGIGMGGLDAKAALFWLFVGIPLAWGIWNTVEKALVLFR